MTARTLALPALLLGTIALGGCELKNPLEDLDLRVDVDDVAIDLPASAATVGVQAGEPTVNGGDVDNDNDYASIEELETIRLKPEFFAFSRSAAAPGARTAQASGTISVFLFMGGVPVPGTPINVTVENDVVTAVSPTELNIGSATVNASSVSEFLNSLPAGSQPDLSNWQQMSTDDVVEEINAALASNNFPFFIGVSATGDLNGSLQLQQISFDAQVVLAGN